MASLWSRQEEEEEEEEVGLLDFLGQDKCSSSSTTNSASSSRSSRTSSAGSANSSPRPLGLHLLDMSQNVVDCTLSLGCAPSSASAPPPWRSCHDVSPSPGQSSPAPCYTPRQQPPRPVPISVYSNIPSTSAWGSPSPSRSPSPSPSPSSSQGGVGNYFIRICTNCKTTHTPLWRNGPHGPKSLCNACGIRYKKEGRRMRSTSSILHDEPLDRSNVNTTMAVVMPIVMDTEFDVVSIRGGKRWTTWPTTTTAINNNTTTCSCLDDDNENYKISLQQRFASAFPL